MLRRWRNLVGQPKVIDPLLRRNWSWLTGTRNQVLLEKIKSDYESMAQMQKSGEIEIEKQTAREENRQNMEEIDGLLKRLEEMDAEIKEKDAAMQKMCNREQAERLAVRYQKQKDLLRESKAKMEQQEAEIAELQKKLEDLERENEIQQSRLQLSRELSRRFQQKLLQEAPVEKPKPKLIVEKKKRTVEEEEEISRAELGLRLKKISDNLRTREF
jgi:chromosome segregation ATPase